MSAEVYFVGGSRNGLRIDVGWPLGSQLLFQHPLGEAPGPDDPRGPAFQIETYWRHLMAAAELTAAVADHPTFTREHLRRLPGGSVQWPIYVADGALNDPKFAELLNAREVLYERDV